MRGTQGTAKGEQSVPLFSWLQDITDRNALHIDEHKRIVKGHNGGTSTTGNGCTCEVGRVQSQNRRYGRLLASRWHYVPQDRHKSLERAIPCLWQGDSVMTWTYGRKYSLQISDLMDFHGDDGTTGHRWINNA